MVDHFTNVRGEIAQRRIEVMNFWAGVRTWEVPPPAPQPFNFKAGKGLVVVYSYGLLEFSVTKLVAQLTQLIKLNKVRAKDYIPSIRALVHEPKIQSIMSTSEKKGLKQRLALYEEIYQKSECAISDAVLSSQMQNVWAVSLENIFMVFGIKESPFFDRDFGSKVDRLVDDRNAVAHGRESPERVGERYTSPEVDKLIMEVDQQVSYVASCMSQYYDGREFVAPPWRHRYP